MGTKHRKEGPDVVAVFAGLMTRLAARSFTNTKLRHVEQFLMKMPGGRQ